MVIEITIRLTIAVVFHLLQQRPLVLHVAYFLGEARQREADRQTDRQTDRRTDRQAGMSRPIRCCPLALERSEQIIGFYPHIYT
jgi:hypothetical protein